ncbi:uncharacterized protein [Ptychodera flava]|uniref:uncharacterized protein n=1 Tax=Ptychodera flava TaxID=63121 RepID=UPI00396A4DE2
MWEYRKCSLELEADSTEDHMNEGESAVSEREPEKQIDVQTSMKSDECAHVPVKHSTAFMRPSLKPRKEKITGYSTNTIPRDLRRPSTLFTGSGHEECREKIHEYFNSNTSDGGTKDDILIQKIDRDALKKENSPNSVRQLVLAQLGSIQNWLLVIDNADDPDLIQAAIFQHEYGLGNGRLLITTRVEDGWNHLLYHKLMPVPSFSVNDSALYLIRQTKSINGELWSVKEAEDELKRVQLSETEEYAALLWLGGDKGLNGLPLALKQASEYLQKHKISFQSFKARLCERFSLDVFKLCENDPLIGWLKLNDINYQYGSELRKAVGDHTHHIKKLGDKELKAIVGNNEDDLYKLRKVINSTSINDFVQMPNINRMNLVTTWEMNYREITMDECTKDFLHLCSSLTSPIEVGFLVDAVGHLKSGKLHDFVIETKQSNVDIQEKIMSLFENIMKYSFATAASGNKSENHINQSQYSLHRLLQQVVFLRFMTDEEKIECLNNTLNILERLLTEINEDDKENGNEDSVRKRRSRIVMHTLTASKFLTTINKEVIPKINNPHNLLMAVSTRLFWMGRPDDAKSLCERMVYVNELRQPRSTLELAEEYKQLGRGYLDTKDLGKAEEYYKKSEEYLMKDKDQKSIDVLNAKQAVARVMQQKENLQDKQKRSIVKDRLLEILEDKYKYCAKDEERFTIAHALHQLGRYHEDIGNYVEGNSNLAEAIKESRRSKICQENVIEQLNKAVMITNYVRNLNVTSQTVTQEMVSLLEEALNIKKSYRTQAEESYQKGLYYLVLLHRNIGDQNHLDCEAELDLMYKEKLEKEGHEDIKIVFEPERLWL